MNSRSVIIEKWKSYDYIDSVGCRIWLDRYGEVVKAEDKNGRAVWVGKKGLSSLEPGFIFAPYIPAMSTPIVIGRDIRDGLIKCKDVDGNITVVGAP